MFELHDSKPSIAGRVAARAAAWPAWRSPFGVLCRTFFAQFFTNESVTSDVHLRQTIVWALAFLLVPGMFIMINLLPVFAFTAIRVNAGRIPASRLDDLLVWSAFLLTTYSMASMGFITVRAWDSLTFNRRDAMVLGALPLSRMTMLGAKLSALGAFLLAGSIPVNWLNATVFALATADLLGGAALVKHFIGLLTATVGAGVLCFTTIITVRAMVAVFGGPRLASACGPPLQFLFVVAMLSLILVCVFGVQISLTSASVTNVLPSAWFAGLFETIRGSPCVFDPQFGTRVCDPQLGFWMLAQRALVATPIALVAAVVMSIVEFRRHMRFALAPPASPGVLGRAPVGRFLASLIVGRDLGARATSDFILLTLARNRSQQAPIAITMALGVAIIMAALLSNTRDFASLMHPRTANLWIPLVVAYWMTIGLRASFFVPSELSASWTFQANASETALPYWSAVRASMIAFVVPRTLIVVGLLVPFLGWRVTALHAVFVGTLVVLFIEVIALTIDHIPFTRTYRPGHANLKTRWVVYLLGLYVFAYLPTRLELWLGQSAEVFGIVGFVMAITVVLEFVVRRRQRSLMWSAQTIGELDEDPFSEATRLDLSGVFQSAHR